MSRALFKMIAKEKKRQDETIELIASENFVSPNVMKAVGSCLTNKYAEGYPGHRYYGGCKYIDEIEEYCKKMWQEVFHTNYHVNVQPHSGSDANQAAYLAVLKPGDTILSMSLNDGGHLSHGSKANLSGKIYNVIHYGVTDFGYIDWGDFEEKIIKHRPKLIVLGASAYPREICFDRAKLAVESACNRIIKQQLKDDDFGEIDYSHPYKPLIMADIAHIAGLVATGFHPTPFKWCDIVTTTTHKTLRGPRGGLIFCKPELSKAIDKAVFPGIQGGPLMHVIAGKAVAAEEAQQPEYVAYIHQVILNCKAMAHVFDMHPKIKVITGGTDNHLLLLDLTETGLTGLEVEQELERHGITVNKNCIHNEKRPPTQASGIRIGTAAMTTKDWVENDAIDCANKICKIIDDMEVRNRE